MVHGRKSVAAEYGLIPVLCLTALSGCAVSAEGSAFEEAHAFSPPTAAAVGPGVGAGLALKERATRDPGTGPWEPVPEAQVLEQCGLDPEALRRADEALAKPWLAIRYGRLCHAHKADMAPEEPFSVTKLFGTVVAGAVSYQTQELPTRGRKTGPFGDEDRVDHWLDNFAYHRDAQVAHVLAMVARSSDLSFGKREMEYDYIGVAQLDSLNFMLNAALQQPGAQLGGDLEQFTRRHVYAPLGMRASNWSLGLPNKTFAWGWQTTILDMARVGWLLMQQGRWNNERIITEEWAYRMTHPAFEDANTGMGYCTWLNARANFNTGGVPVPETWQDLTAEPRFPGPCAPVSIYRDHPHGLSESLDCNYGPSYGCEQRYDDGVWQSFAGYGTVIQGHPGLDLLLVAFQIVPDDFFAAGSSQLLWDSVRPAVVAADPIFAGDEAGFCEAYGDNRYAPALSSSLSQQP